MDFMKVIIGAVKNWVGSEFSKTVPNWARQPEKPSYAAQEVGADPAGAADQALSEAKNYADEKIAGLVNSAPETLDTLGELAVAMRENEDVAQALDAAVVNKAEKDHKHAWSDLEDRPFYEFEECIVISEGEESRRAPIQHPKEGYGVQAGASTYYLSSGALIPGDTYIVTFDGVDYVGIAQTGSNHTTSNPNVYLFSSSDTLSDEAPVSIYTNGSFLWCYYDYTGSVRVPLKITHVVSGIKHLDEKFIPDTIARNEFKVIEIDVLDYLGSYYAPIKQAREEGKIVIIRYTRDGEEFVSSNVEVTDTGFRFVFLASGGKVFSCSYDSSNPVSVAAATRIEDSSRKLNAWRSSATGSETYYPSIKAMEEYVSDALPCGDIKVDTVLCSEKQIASDLLLYIEGVGSYSASITAENYVKPAVGNSVTCTVNGESMSGTVGEHTFTDAYTGTETTVLGCGNLKLVAGSNGEDTGEIAFVRFEDDEALVYVASGEDVVISLSVVLDGIKIIDEKYIPDSVKAQPDWNQNDPKAADYVKGRTHYEETEIITVVDEGDYILGDSGGTPYCELPMNEGVIDNQSYIIYVNGVAYEATSSKNSCIAVWRDENSAHISIESGGWTYFDYDYVGDLGSTGDSVRIRVTRVNKVNHTIDPKYLPTTVPVIPTATVGQTIVVKAVDADGKPTEWEAADVNTGSDTLSALFTINTDYNGYSEVTCNKTYAEIAEAWGKSAIYIQCFRRAQTEPDAELYAESYIDISPEHNLQYVRDEGNEHIYIYISGEVINYYPSGEILIAGTE